jgi:hypothetical protein
LKYEYHPSIAVTFGENFDFVYRNTADLGMASSNLAYGWELFEASHDLGET